MKSEINSKLVIDSKEYERQHSILVFLTIWNLVWTPMTVILSFVAINDPNIFWLIWLLFGYIGSIFGGLALINPFRVQTLELIEDKLIITGAGLLPNTSVIIDLNKSVKIGLERDSDDILVLFIEYNRRWFYNRILLAQYLSDKSKKKIYEEIKYFLRNND